MLGEKIWRLIEAYFKPSGTSDSFGKPAKMSGFVLFAIWALRFCTGWRLSVNHGYKTDGHSKGSQHYKATAIDFHFLTDVPYHEQIEKVERILKDWQLFNFVGLGIYPDANTPFFHIDARGRKARWGFLGGVQVSYKKAKEAAKNEA
jgi:hypothetical protein